MDYYKKYQQELYGRDILETEHGFIIYKFFPEDSLLYIHSLYIDERFRKLSIGKNLEQSLIDSLKPDRCLCYVDLETRNPELSLKAILAANYNILKVDSNKIVLEKRIK